MPLPADGAKRDDLAGLLQAALEHAVPTLGPGWRLQYRAPRSGGNAAAPRPGISAVLINAELGVALLDVVPRITAGEQPSKPAEELRGQLKAGGVPATLLRSMPIVHLVVTPGRMTRLSEALRYAFSWEPPLGIPLETKWADRIVQIVSAAPVERAGRIRSADPASPAPASRPGPHSRGTRPPRAAGRFLLPQRR
jgi:hypothetical protein